MGRVDHCLLRPFALCTHQTLPQSRTPLLGLSGEIGAADRPDKNEVSRESGIVSNLARNTPFSMSRSVLNLYRGPPYRYFLAVIDPLEFDLALSTVIGIHRVRFVEEVWDAEFACQFRPAGDVVRVHVSVCYGNWFRSCLRDKIEVGGVVARRIDDKGLVAAHQYVTQCTLTDTIKLYKPVQPARRIEFSGYYRQHPRGHAASHGLC